MATRPIRGGGVEQNRPIRQQQRPGVRPVYEDFRPVFERHQEEDAEKLLIYLPGFSKENIRVSTEGKNTVRVRGERLVGGNKWNRFQEDFQAPDDCNMRGIHAKFENGILIITMPRKIPTTQTPQPTPPKDAHIPPKTTHNPTIEPPRQPAPLKPSAQLPKPATMEKQGVDKKILEGQPAETSKGTNQSLKQTPPLGTTIGGKEEKPRDEKKIIQGSAESSKGTNEALKAAPLEKTSGEDKILEGLAGLIQKGAEKEKLDQNSTQMVKGGKESHGVVTRKDTEKSKELKGEFQEKVEQKGSKEKESTSDVAAGTSYPAADFSLTNLKKSLTELNEERQLLVNCGAAVLVIMAFGAYVYHSIGSGRAE